MFNVVANTLNINSDRCCSPNRCFPTMVQFLLLFLLWYRVAQSLFIRECCVMCVKVCEHTHTRSEQKRAEIIHEAKLMEQQLFVCIHSAIIVSYLRRWHKRKLYLYTGKLAEYIQTHVIVRPIQSSNVCVLFWAKHSEESKCNVLLRGASSNIPFNTHTYSNRSHNCGIMHADNVPIHAAAVAVTIAAVIVVVVTVKCTHNLIKCT